jgi:hypothetical protein
MFEAKCKDCEAVYSIEEESTPKEFECLCGCIQFKVKENTLVVA